MHLLGDLQLQWKCGRLYGIDVREAENVGALDEFRIPALR
jgi:hypothetical protein